RHHAGDLARRWFPERQIILRQHDSVKAIRLAPGIQLIAASVLVTGALWTAGATGAYLASRIAVADVRWENDQLRVGYRFVDRLTDEARRSISEVERIVGAARLDLKRLVPQRADGRRQNSGGPFVPWNKQTGDQPQAAAPAAATPDIARLDELLRLLRSMPLS